MYSTDVCGKYTSVVIRVHVLFYLSTVVFKSTTILDFYHRFSVAYLFFQTIIPPLALICLNVLRPPPPNGSHGAKNESEKLYFIVKQFFCINREIHLIMAIACLS